MSAREGACRDPHPPDSPQREIITVQHLSRVFRHPRAITAVNNVTFSILEGEIFGLLGPNGAGKTTLFRMLTTLLRPSSGVAFVDGHSITEEPDIIRSIIGVCSQTTTLDPDLTAWENLDFYGELLNLDPGMRDARIRHLLGVSGLIDRGGLPVRTFSRGMMRRLEIVRAFIHNPRILFLDEPTMGLDPASRQAIWGQIRELNGQGVTAVLTTHYMDEAARLCHRVAFMDKGEIVAVGNPKSLVDRIFTGEIIEVSLTPASEGLCDEVRGIPGVISVRVDGSLLQIVTGNPDQVLPELHRLIPSEGASLTDPVVRPPTLEDVFIRLTGDARRGRERQE
jgi:ABC-2 type transport system ATP-binding protein